MFEKLLDRIDARFEGARQRVGERVLGLQEFIRIIGPSSIPAISLKIAVTAGAVTSVRIPPATTKGPALRRKMNCDEAPYV